VPALTPRSRRLRAVALVASGVVLAVAAIGYLIGGPGHQAASPPPPPGCQAGTGVAALPLATDQAGIAATIAGVAARHGLGQRAVTIAYATALQESKLQNLTYGDLDSVGVFQQRPSQGWGTTAELEDPVYATTKFFAALVKVPGYTTMPVDQAAQDVQHSADGYAYEQWVADATLLAHYFTGNWTAGVSCWYSPSGTADLSGALRGLTSTFGRGGRNGVSGAVSLDRSAQKKGGSSAPPAGKVAVVHVPRATAWAVAGWLVAYAQRYGLSQVAYAGYEWTAANGSAGWQRVTAQSLAGSAVAALAAGQARGSIVAG
jgi:hypothetical protein